MLLRKAEPYLLRYPPSFQTAVSSNERLGKMNMTQSHKDPCIFVKLMDSGNYVRCGLYVDDNLTSGTTADLDIFEAEYRSHIPLITVSKGPPLQHLGVTLDLSSLRRPTPSRSYDQQR